jgi:hypothetical protein
MSLRNLCRSAVLVFLVGLFGAGSLQAGPWWWEKHFDGEYYSPLHYWLPGAYRVRAYCHPVPFEPLADAPPRMPPPAEMDKNALPGDPKVEQLPPPSFKNPSK